MTPARSRPGRPRTDDIPLVLRRWLAAELGETGAQVSSPLTAAALAAERRSTSDGLPDEVLDAWAYLLDDHRCILAQSERSFIEHARSSGWPDSAIGRALLTADTDLTRRVAELDEFVRGPERPGPA